MAQTIKHAKELKAFIEFRANPDNMGKALDMWADENGIARSTVYSWSSNKDIKLKILAYFNDNYRKDEVAIVSALINKAKTGDIPAINLYAKWILDFREKSEVEHSGTLDINADDLAEAIKNAKNTKTDNK